MKIIKKLWKKMRILKDKKNIKFYEEIYLKFSVSRSFFNKRWNQ